MPAAINLKKPASHRPPPRKDNVDFVQDLMTYGTPLKQIIICEAIAQYASQIVADLDPDNPPANWPGLISPHAWHQAASEIQTACKTRFGGQ